MTVFLAAFISTFAYASAEKCPLLIYAITGRNWTSDDLDVFKNLKTPLEAKGYDVARNENETYDRYRYGTSPQPTNEAYERYTTSTRPKFQLSVSYDFGNPTDYYHPDYRASLRVLLEKQGVTVFEKEMAGKVTCTQWTSLAGHYQSESLMGAVLYFIPNTYNAVSDWTNQCDEGLNRHDYLSNRMLKILLKLVKQMPDCDSGKEQ